MAGQIVYICEMEPYVVSFRKYRPQRFDTVVGQMHITSTLKNAIKSNQLAQAFLFCGPRGVGKTTCARIFAKTINCIAIDAEGEACDQCDSCLSFNRGTSLAIHELDAASNNSVDDIRNLVDQVRYAPQGSKYKIYIIDEVHMLSSSAFNAFLKTLEEPPPYAIFILATTERHKILPTILSRCQIFDFNRIRVGDISKQLAEICEKEEISFEGPALHVIAQKADGALRDALSMLDQIVSFSAGKLTFQAVIDNLNIIDYEYYFKCTDMLRLQQLAEVSLLFDEVNQKGFEGINFIVGLAEHFRNLLMAKDARTVKLLEQSEEVQARYLEQTQQTDTGFLLSALNIASHCEVNYKQSKNPRLLVELALMKMCFVYQLVEPEQSAALAEKKKGTAKPIVAELLAAPAAVEVKTISRPTRSAPSATSPSGSADQTLSPSKPAVASVKVSSTISKTKSNLDQYQETSTSALQTLELPEKQNIGQPIEQLPFGEAWKKMLLSLKVEKKDFLHAIVSQISPIPDEKAYFLIPVYDAAQQKALEEAKLDLLIVLRQLTSNQELNFGYDEIILAESAIRPVSSNEKLSKMVEKNPNVLEFVKRFDLETEY